MQVSGFIDTRQRNPSRAQPEYRPSQNCAVSPIRSATIAARRTPGTDKVCDAAAAPAATSAIAAGNGSPIASANSKAKVSA